MAGRSAVCTAVRAFKESITCVGKAVIVYFAAAFAFLCLNITIGEFAFIRKFLTVSAAVSEVFFHTHNPVRIIRTL